VDHTAVTDLLKERRSTFEGRFLFVVPADEDLSKLSWNSQEHHTRKIWINKAHMLFSSNSGTRLFALGQKHKTVNSFRVEFGEPKPCIHGSDAHSYDALFEPSNHRHLWVKADPTFDGLRQLLYEPADRVYIGEEPPSLARIRQNATKYIDAVAFERTNKAIESAKWFSGTTHLNHGLVAIIGNKGNGKSALADVIAYLGDTTVGREHFSFLTEERFLAPKSKLGEMFRATIKWYSADNLDRQLDKPLNANVPESVKYLPQRYLEQVCAELRESADTQFDRELMDVIFSHVDEPGRLGKNTLGELIDYLAETKRQHIAQLCGAIEDLNERIVAFEDQTTEEYRLRIASQLEKRRSELLAHDKAKPVEVKEPQQDAATQEAMQKLKAELAKLQSQLDDIDKKIQAARDSQVKAKLQLAASDRLLRRTENLEREVASFYEDSSNDGATLELDLTKLVVLNVDRDPIAHQRSKALETSEAAELALDEDVDGSVANQRIVISTAIEEKLSQLDEPNQRYQAYLDNLSDWNAKRALIRGSTDVEQSVLGLEAKLESLALIPGRLAELRQRRGEITDQIFEMKQQLLDDFRRLYSPVQRFINEHPVSQQHGALEFSATIAVDGFVDGLLNQIHQGRKGSFQHDAGRDRARQLVKVGEFSSTEGVRAFLESVWDHLERDHGVAAPEPVRVRDQLRQEFTPQGLYNFIYGLSYLRPRFELRWQGKTLDQLSPGERGNLLLVFYLLIDKRDVPLVIDQPEENLDNHTVTETLVPAIKHAKQERQIILVTHNPNLAVVCDAEQIIHARIDKTDGNRLIYKSGSIEDPEITRLIVDVLEGTKPAFDRRDARYEVLDRLLGEHPT
jgi:ABC-type lipoprotein export system ATPase subunit